MESDELLPNARRASVGGGGRSGRGVLPTSQDVTFDIPAGGSEGMSAGGRGTWTPNYSSTQDGDDGGGDGGGGSGKRMGKARSFTIPLVMPGSSMMRRAKSSAGLLMRQSSGADDAIWSAEEVAKEDVATAISRDLVAKAERWKQLAGEPLMEAPVMPLLAKDVNKHEVASIYVKDALAGRNSSACIHNKMSVHAVKVYRNKAWNQLLNICTIVHLALPMIQIQRCLPCLGAEKLADDANVLHIGWQPTALGSMWIESVLCLLYAYHLRQEAVSRLGSIPEGELRGNADRAEGGPVDGVEGDEERGFNRDRENEAQREVYSLFALPPWQLARTCMVVLLGLSLFANLISHYALGITWFSWRHVILPFLFISRRTYLKHFVAATFRLLPRMVPVVFLISFVTFFYGFLGYIVYRDEPHDSPVLSELQLFDEAPSSALTFLRIFTARSFMLDVDIIYGARRDMEVMVLSYGVIMFIFLLALVPAVATHNFIGQSKKSYHWVKEQRKVALTRAFMLLKKPDGTLAREDFVQLMACLRPDCDQEHTSALFTAAKKAEEQQSRNSGGGLSALAIEDERNRLSKMGFFMLCALGTADFSRRQNERMMMNRKKRTKRERSWARTRRKMNAALLWTRPGGHFPVSQQVLNVALLIQGYQIIKSGDDPEGRPDWAYPLGAFLIFFFFLHSAVRMIAGGTREYFLEWRNNLDMSLNLCGIVYYAGLWPRGQAFHSLYQILQALRLELLWVNVHLLGPISSGVATRLEFVFPAVIRASFVLFAVTYAYAVVAFAMYCDTPLGTGEIGHLKDDAMVQRFASVKAVTSFATLPQSFISMMYVVMFSNWPLYMDAAGEVGNLMVAKMFFYSFKVVGFYFIMPVLLGSSVTSYINVQVPNTDSGPGKAPPSTSASAASPPPPRPDGGSTIPRRRFSEAGSGGSADGEQKGNSDEKEEGNSPAVNLGRKSLYRRSSFSDDITSRSKDGTKFGYSTLADGAHKEIDVDALAARGSEETLVDSGEPENGGERADDADQDDGGDNGGAADRGKDDGDRPRGAAAEYDDEGGGADVDDSSTEDNYAPVIVESRSRSLSQTFWGVHQAKDGNPATLLQGALARLEAEIAGLRSENASLRAAASTREASARLYVAEMEEETKTPAGDGESSLPETSSSRRAGVDIGIVNAAGEMGKPLFSTSPEVVNSLRSRVISSANTIWGMPAIFETEDGAGASDDVV